MTAQTEAVVVPAAVADPFQPVIVPPQVTTPATTAQPVQPVTTAPAAATPVATTVQVPTPAATPPASTSSEPIPSFEGAKVEVAQIKVTGNSSIDTYGDGDERISLDDRVRLVGDFRCMEVKHRVDPKTGDVVREMILKPLDLQLTPWDPSDPTDKGIVKARP